MPVKYWSRAGLMLTDWCNARCACCYANCSPSGQTWLSVDDALSIWAGLIEASPHGCRVHLTGGEVFGRFDVLLDVCRRARREGLGPLEAIETNGFWATDDAIVRRRLEALSEAGLGRIAISSDPYHQQFVPIERARRLARVAEDVLGAARVRVRWRDWLASGHDTGELTEPARQQEFISYAAEGRDRFTGRAADGLDGKMVLKPAADFDDNPCKERLLRGRHVHIAPTGEVWPATCVGVVAGNALTESIRTIWNRLHEIELRMPMMAALSASGPAAVAAEARKAGFVPRPDGYAGKCQLCYDVRRFLHEAGQGGDWLGPSGVYQRSPADGSGRTAPIEST